jgi:cysteine desulfurase NifS/selenium donor protein
MPPIYLDYNATTPVLQEIAEEMKPYLLDFFGNPSSTHWYGQQTKKAIELARRRVADLLNCHSDEIIFTSGGSESNNYALKGVAFALKNQGKHIITSQIEHPAITEVCGFLKNHGFRISFLPVDDQGIVDPADLEKEITSDTILISIMHANNEVGTIQPISEISRIAHNRNVLIHTDAAQSIGKIRVDVEELGIDLLSVAGHKLYAPKGIGALYIRRGVRLAKQIHGANHEQNLRAGTENVLEIVGLGKACEVAARDLTKNIKHMQTMNDRLHHAITHDLKEIADLKVNGHPQRRLPNTLSISFANIEANTLLAQIESEVAASAGAACHSDEINISATLNAMRIPVSYAMGTIRLSTGRLTTAKEVDRAAKIISSAIKKMNSSRQGDKERANIPGAIRLTQYTQGLGCACKLRPQALEQVLQKLPRINNPDVLVSAATADDAAVYLINDKQAIVQSVDFFTPIVDDPFDFGRIAAANALSDLYAMGAQPLFALNIVAFPSHRLPLTVLEQILSGAQKIAEQADISIIGGHTIDDTEPKFGMAVSGVVHPAGLITNSGSKPGDTLILTKPLGTGILTTALKRGLLSEEAAEILINTMAALNRETAELMKKFKVHACTDVTGFGLLGHLYEMTKASGVEARIDASKVPLLDPVSDLAAAGVIPGGTENNLKYFNHRITWSDRIAEIQKYILCDAQTSGGLLISVAQEDAENLYNSLKKSAAIIGEITKSGQGEIFVSE